MDDKNRLQPRIFYQRPERSSVLRSILAVHCTLEL